MKTFSHCPSTGNGCTVGGVFEVKKKIPVYYTIHNGIRLTGMPAWGVDVKDDDSWKLVLFIRHLKQLTPAEEHEMESLNPKGPGEKQEEQEEQQFLNEDPPTHQAPKPSSHQNP